MPPFNSVGDDHLRKWRDSDNRCPTLITLRDLKPPLGVRAVPSVETHDGFKFDFAHDRNMLDTRTPIGKDQGSGFGPTVQLKDGTLVTSYSYRGADNRTHLEIVRWRLPVARTP
jgi:hypothetical protein